MEIWRRVRDAVGDRGGNGPRYQLVGGVDQALTNFKNRSSRAKTIILSAGTIVFLMLLYIAGHVYKNGEQSRVSSAEKSSPGYLHLLMTAPKRDVNLCKSLLSAGVLGFPDPTLVGWGEANPEDEESKPKQYSSLDQLKQVYDYLAQVQDDDLVIIADGYQTWFQLRPQTLLNRYYAVNQAADQRLAHEIRTKVALHQKILFASQRTCDMSNEQESPACYAAPESTLLKDTYGSETDISNSRPRYPNAGFAMGTASALRTLYSSAATRVQDTSTLRSLPPHQVLAHLFGEQQLHRELLRRSSESWLHRLLPFLSSSKSRDAIKFKQSDLAAVEALAQKGQTLEFGIGLDYTGFVALSAPTDKAGTGELAFLTWNDEERLYTANEVLHIPQSASQISSLPTDLRGALPPFWTFTEEGAGVPRTAGWDAVALLADVRTGVVPATLHLPNGEVGDKKTEWWGSVWFQKQVRTLYSAHVYAPLTALAVTHGGARTWWGREDWKGGARTAEGWWVRFDDVCRGFEDEVFRDGGGEWVLPDNH